MNMTFFASHPRTQPGVAPHALAQAWHRLAARWAEHLSDARRAREADALSQLSVDTLRDIGAPEPWVARAAHRREMAQQHLREMRQWRAG